MMEERKRTFDGTAIPGDMQMNMNQPKRLRPEEIVGGRDDPSKAISRLLLNRSQFSRIIGKGGQTIAQIRNNTGVLIKGSDIDDDNRLVILTGTLDQVLSAFDVIVELLHQAAIAEYTAMVNSGMMLAPRSMDHIVVTLLLEHNKAGKAVGAKGAMMQTIKVKSSAAAIRIDKEPIEVTGVSLRRLTIEGTLASIRRAHLLVQELYSEPAALSSSASYNAYAAQGGAVVSNGAGGPLEMHAHAHRTGYGSGPSAYDAPIAPIGAGGVAPAATHMVTVPFQNLINFGVQAETVRQLTEMKGYLWKHFGLDLNISREEPLPVGASRAAAPVDIYGNALANKGIGGAFGGIGVVGGAVGVGGGVRSMESVIENRKATNPNDICFSIPKTAVGAVIGKGGQNLRDLQAEFGVRVFIEKEDFNGKRLVVLSFVGQGPDGMNPINPDMADDALRKVQAHVEGMVQDCMNQRQAQLDAAAYGSGEFGQMPEHQM